MTKKELVVADFGGGSWTVLINSQIIKLSPESFLQVKSWCPPGAMLVAEDAHLARQRTKLSLAQVYKEQELLAFYDNCKALDIELRMFPQSQTPWARAQWALSLNAEPQKSDDNDVMAIHYIVSNDKAIARCLKKPPTSFEPPTALMASWQLKDDINATLNVARSFAYKAEGDKISQFLQDHLEDIAARMSPQARKIFGLHERKRNGSFKTDNSRLSKLYTLAAMWMDETGEIRRRPDTNQPPGIDWLMSKQLAQSPFHHKGGIARSNMMWHGFRNYAISCMETRKASANGKVLSHYDFSPEQTAEFRAHRRDYRLAMRETLRIMRDLLVAK